MMKNINDDLTDINEIINEEENTKKNNINAYKSTKTLPKNVILSQVTRGDLLLFKEDFLKTIKNLKEEINIKIKEKLEGCNNLIEDANKRLYNYDTDKNAFLTKLNFIEEKNEILSKIDEIKSKLKNEINVHSIHIETSQKDISNMRFKYDRIVTNNLLVPGLVGPMCKFSNLREYIINDRGEISNIFNTIQTLNDNLKNTKNSISELKDSFIKYQKSNEANTQALLNLKIEQVEKKVENKFESIFDKISAVRIENAAYVQRFLDKEQQLNDYLEKIEEFKINVLEDNKKINEKTKSLSDYTISKLEKSLSEFINIKKCILELSNIFSKQKRSYGDENINENKREVILNFGNMVNGLIKDLMNDKKKLGKSNSPNKKNEFEPDLNKEKNKKDFIDANHNSNKNSYEKMKKFFSTIKISYNSNKDNNNNKKEGELFPKKEFKNNLMFKEIKLYDNYYNNKNINYNDLSSSSLKKLNKRNNKSIINDENYNDNSNKSKRITLRKSKDNISINNVEQNIIKGNNIMDIQNQKFENINYYKNFKKRKSEAINFNTINILNKIEHHKNDKNMKEISVKSENIISYKDLIPKIEERKTIPNAINKEIKNLFSFTQESNSLLINDNIKTDNPNSLNTNKIKSRNNLENNLIQINNNNINGDISREKIMAYTDRKPEYTKQITKELGQKSLNYDSFKQQSINSNIVKHKQFSNLRESSSQENNLFVKNKKIKDNTIDSSNKRPLSKLENFTRKKVTKNNSNFNTINNIKKHLKTNLVLKYNKENNKEIFYDKNIENEIKYIKDKDIIDKPLLSNQENFELIKETGGLEKKILELEYFTKKKFDELVKEIKNFIPIHFNSYLKDYSLSENKIKQKIRK